MTQNIKTIIARIIISCAVLVVIVLMTGCTASSPRFRSKESPSQKNQPSNRNGHFFASKESKEELKEDDKKVDIEVVKPKIISSSEVNPVIDRKKMIGEVLSLVGTPYSFNGDDAAGIDCSGFTAKVYQNALDVSLPHSTVQQYALGIPVQSDERKFGDLVFFNTTGENPSHVGIYLGDDLFAHTSVSMGVTISSLESSYFKKRYIGARRIVK